MTEQLLVIVHVSSFVTGKGDLIENMLILKRNAIFRISNLLRTATLLQQIIWVLREKVCWQVKVGWYHLYCFNLEQSYQCCLGVILLLSWIAGAFTKQQMSWQNHRIVKVEQDLSRFMDNHPCSKQHLLEQVAHGLQTSKYGVSAASLGKISSSNSSCPSFFFFFLTSWQTSQEKNPQYFSKSS